MTTKLTELTKLTDLTAVEPVEPVDVEDSDISQDCWDTRIKEAAKVMGLTQEKVEEILAGPEFGITRDDSTAMEILSSDEYLPFGDFFRLFCDQSKVPIPKLRMAVGYLRGKRTPSKSTIAKVDSELNDLHEELNELNSRYGIKVRLEDLGIEELLPLYNPRKSSRIHKALQSRYGKYGQFIAYRPSTTDIAIIETINYINDLEQGYPAQATIMVDGELVRLYGIGEIPNNEVDEDPLFIGYALKRDRSVVNYLNWSNVSREVRQFVRILVEEGDINPNSKTEKKHIVELIGKTLEDLKEIFPESYLVYREKKETDDLPKLHVAIGGSSHGKKQDPFGIPVRNGVNNRRY